VIARPANTWDYRSAWRSGPGCPAGALRAPLDLRRNSGDLTTAGLILAFAALYAPYTQWNIQAYTNVDLWQGSRTSLRAYLTVHGVFLFFTAAWMAWETIAWMASTPISALARLRPYLIALGWGRSFAA
jgi:hypothetical protein